SLAHKGDDGAVLVTQVCRCDRRALNRPLYVIAEGIADIVNRSNSQDFTERHRNKGPVAYGFTQRCPYTLGRPDVEIKLEHFSRTFDLKGIALDERCAGELRDLKRFAMKQVFRCERGDKLPSRLTLFSLKTMESKARHQIVEAKRRNVIRLSPMRPCMVDQSLDGIRRFAVTKSAPVKDARAGFGVGRMQGVHNGLIAPAIAG